MVGLAQSPDLVSGYKYVVIKVYDCDDLSFVSEAMPCKVYKVERTTLKTEIVFSNTHKSSQRLSLKHIGEIVDMVTLSEYELSHPIALFWEVNASDKCIKKHTAENYLAWPVPPFLINSDDAYINITDMVYKSEPDFLSVSFLCEVLNEALYLCGIYHSDLFVMCGNHIYCSHHMASIEKRIFGSCILYSKLLDFISFKPSKSGISSSYIIKNIKKLKFSHGDYLSGSAESITNIKRECIESICHIILDCIENKKGLTRLVKRLMVSVSRYLYELKGLGTDFIYNSAADTKYLLFKQLLEAYSFADAMRDLPKTVRKNKERIRNLKNLESPNIIYKGKLYIK